MYTFAIQCLKRYKCLRLLSIIPIVSPINPPSRTSTPGQYNRNIMGNKLASRVRTSFSGGNTKRRTPPADDDIISRGCPPLSDTTLPNNNLNAQLVLRKDAKRFVDNDLDLPEEDEQEREAQRTNNHEDCVKAAEVEVVDILGNFTRVDSQKLCASAYRDKKVYATSGVNRKIDCLICVSFISLNHRLFHPSMSNVYRMPHGSGVCRKTFVELNCSYMNEM